MSNYRVVVQYDQERSVFTARAPELGPQCTAEGPTRGEALAKVEEEIKALVENARDQGGAPPPAMDDDLAAWTGAITATVSRSLHRELAYQARVEGVELAQLVGELCAAGLDARRRERPRRASGNVQPQPARDGNDDQPPRRDDRGPRRGFGGGRDRDGRYQAIMEDKATFLEYVRGLESGGAQRGSFGGGSGPPAGRGPRRDNRGPRRGPGPGGGNQGGGNQGGGNQGGPGDESP